jgi:HemY protein
MMRLLIVFIVLLCSILIGLQFSHNPGYVLIAFNHWTIETTLWFALLTFLVFIACLHGLWLICSKLGNISTSWKQYQNRRREAKSLRLHNKEVYSSVQQGIYLSSIVELVNHNRGQALDKLMNNLPRSFRNNPILLTEYLHFLLKTNQHAKAESLLRKQLKISAKTEYINLYGLCYHNVKQLAFAELLLKKNGPSAPLYLCLGRLYVHHKLWGKAKYYLEKSIELVPSPAAYKELGMLYDSLNEPQTASESYKQGLALLSP